MASSHISSHYEFGVAIRETGLNRVSAALRTSRPELFEYSAKIDLKLPDHVVEVYVFVNRPLAFDLFPVTTLPNLQRDSFFVEVDASFSLTDSSLGTVTRMGVKLQGRGLVSVQAEKAQIVLHEFKVIEIRGEHPPELHGPLGADIVAEVLPEVFHADGGDEQMGRTFRAIVNYLIQVFLQQTLQRTIIEFPLPSLNEFLRFGNLGVLPIQAINIRNNSLYTLIGNDLRTPEEFPGEIPSLADLSLGISEEGARRVVESFLPMHLNIDTGNPNGVANLTGSLTIPSLAFDFQPGRPDIPIQVNIGGFLNLRINIGIPVLGGRLIFDIPFPIDKLTHYRGSVFPIINSNIDEITLTLRAASDFLEAWYVLVKMDYANFLRNEFREAARRFRDRLLGKKFCKIPIIGWIICGIIDVAAEVVGFLTGAVLDLVVSSFLTILVNMVGRAVINLLIDTNFNLVTIRQADVRGVLGMGLHDAQIKIVSNGRTGSGELDLHLWFDAQGLPVPPLPAPVVDLPPVVVPLPQQPGLPSLPESDAASFLPALQLPMPVWNNGTTLIFSAEASHDGVQLPKSYVSIGISFTGDRWRVQQRVTNDTGTLLSETTAEYSDDSFSPLRMEVSTSSVDVKVKQAVDYHQNMQITGSFGIVGESSFQRSVNPVVGIMQEFEDMWVYRFLDGSILQAMDGKFARIEVSNPIDAVNWVRQIPVSVKIDEIGQDWVITGQDQERQTVVTVSKGAGGILSIVNKTTSSSVVMTRILE